MKIDKVPSTRKDGRRGFDPGIAVRRTRHEVDQKLAGGWLSTKEIIRGWLLARCGPARVGVCEQFSVVLGPPGCGGRADLWLARRMSGTGSRRTPSLI